MVFFRRLFSHFGLKPKRCCQQLNPEFTRGNQATDGGSRTLLPLGPGGAPREAGAPASPKLPGEAKAGLGPVGRKGLGVGLVPDTNRAGQVSRVFLLLGLPGLGMGFC